MNLIFLFSLGVVHDGTGVASSCLATNSYIMAPGTGPGSNASNLNYFSTCSISQFKTFLLTADLR